MHPARKWVSVLGLVAAALIGAASTTAAERERPAGVRERSEEVRAGRSTQVSLGGDDIYRATGASDFSGGATVVHCTNLGAATITVFVSFLDFNGSVDCSLSHLVAANETRTFATRGVAAYAEDATCSVAPGLNQGSLVISSSASPPPPLMCNVQVVDPAAVTPVFLATLDLFRP